MNPQGAHRVIRESALKYLPDFAFVEQVLPDGARLFPHTEQLPVIWKAAMHEFTEELPNRIVKTDGRADDERKHMLYHLVTQYCDVKNLYREDGLILFPVIRRDLVTRLAVAQKITIPEPGGNLYTFRLFCDGGYFPDIQGRNKPFAFTAHCFERFRERFTDRDKVPLAAFLKIILHSVGLLMRVNGREESLIYDFTQGSLLAVPVELRAGRWSFRTCLSVNEINSLEPIDARLGLIFQHGSAGEKNVILNQVISGSDEMFRQRWLARAQPDRTYYTRMQKSAERHTWHTAVQFITKSGYIKWTPGSSFCFFGNVHTAGVQVLPPGAGPPLPLQDEPDQTA